MNIFVMARHAHRLLPSPLAGEGLVERGKVEHVPTLFRAEPPPPLLPFGHPPPRGGRKMDRHTPQEVSSFISMAFMRLPCVSTRCDGFVLPSAIFLLVILASLAAFMVTISQIQNVTLTQDVQGSRAYQAARAGIEWGLYQVLDPGNATVVAPTDATWPGMPACVPNTSLTIEGFAVSVRCTPYDYFEDGNDRRIRVYHLVATAQFGGAPGAMSYIERQAEATVSKCRSAISSLPGYECS